MSFPYMLSRMQPASRIYVAGHTGLVGSAICRVLAEAGYTNVIRRTHAELELCDQQAVEQFFAQQRPQFVFLAAARVGGIHANSTYPAEFLTSNLQVQTNVIDAARRHDASKLLILGSVASIRVTLSSQFGKRHCFPGPLEPTNEWYAIAKIAGLKMCQAYRKQYKFDAISLMPTNLYGPGDNFHPESSHVLPAMIHRFHQARLADLPSVTIWGSGTPRREFLHVNDFARAAVFLMDRYSDEGPLNIGAGEDLQIIDLARLVARIVGYRGQILTDTSRPDGTPRKLLDVSRVHALGWRARIPLEDGVRDTYIRYVADLEAAQWEVTRKIPA